MPARPTPRSTPSLPRGAPPRRRPGPQGILERLLGALLGRMHRLEALEKGEPEPELEPIKLSRLTRLLWGDDAFSERRRKAAAQ